MPGLNYSNLVMGLGVLLLVWALAVRRSRTDMVLLAISGLLLLFAGFRPTLSEAGARFGLLPELLTALFGLVLLVRVFLTRLGIGHKLGFAAAGCLMLVPALLLAGVIALFAMGSGHDSRIANESRPAANAAEPILNTGATP
jgi:hypothetical protein